MPKIVSSIDAFYQEAIQFIHKCQLLIKNCSNNSIREDLNESLFVYYWEVSSYKTNEKLMNLYHAILLRDSIIDKLKNSKLIDS